MADEPLWSVRTHQLATACVAVLGVVTTGLGIFTSLKSAEAAEQAHAAERAAADRDFVAEQTHKDRDYTVSVFEKAYAALGSDNRRQQDAALALVVSLPDSSFRSGMIAAFAGAAEPVVAQRATGILADEGELAAQMAADRRASVANSGADPVGANTRVLSQNPDGFDVDVFWCDGGPSAAGRQAMALRVAEALATSSQAGRRVGPTTVGRVRLRLLPASTNAMAGYRLSTNVVFYDSGFDRDARVEPELARAIADDAERITSRPFSAVPTVGGRETKWMVSAFICGSAD